MNISHSTRILVPFLLFALAACSSPDSAEPPTAPTSVPTAIVVSAATTTVPAAETPTSVITTEPTVVPIAEPVQLSFVPATYTDENAGIALDYPVEWTIDPSSQVGIRGGQALLLSPGSTVDTLADDGTRVSIITYSWDPKNDLDAYVAQRKIAWDASGFAIIEEAQWQLTDGRPAYSFVVKTPEQPTFTVFTTVGQDYLQLSGDGDSTLVEEIARTLRPLE